MDLNKYTTRLHDDLVAAAALGDEKTQATAAALASATENAVRLTVLAALSDLAEEINATLDDRTVHVALSGTDARVEVRREPSEGTDQPPTFEEMTGDISRVTLRMVENLKSRAEDAANESGQSLNSWLSTVVRGALYDQMRKGPGPYDN